MTKQYKKQHKYRMTAVVRVLHLCCHSEIAGSVIYLIMKIFLTENLESAKGDAPTRVILDINVTKESVGWK